MSSSGSSSKQKGVPGHVERVPVPDGYAIDARYIDPVKIRVVSYLKYELSRPSCRNSVIVDHKVLMYSKRMVQKGKYTLHIDGSFIPGGRGGFGALLRLSDGTFFAAIFGITTEVHPKPASAIIHELEGALHGVNLCRSLNIPLSDVTVVCDCKIIQEIFDDFHASDAHGEAVMDMCSKFKRECNLFVPFMRHFAGGVEIVYRQENWPADCLSKLAGKCGSLPVTILPENLSKTSHFSIFLIEICSEIPMFDVMIKLMQLILNDRSRELGELEEVQATQGSGELMPLLKQEHVSMVLGSRSSVVSSSVLRKK